MTENLIQKINTLQFPSCKTLKSLKDLRSGIALCEMLAFAKSKPLPPNLDPEDFLKKNSRIKSLKKMTETELQATATEILKFLPRPVPLLNLGNLQKSQRTTSATQRSYLTSYVNRSKKDLTPSVKRRAEPVVYVWINELGLGRENILRDVQSGVLLCELVNCLEHKRSIREFFKPTKTLAAAKVNLNKVLDHLKMRKFQSRFLEITEILAGSEIFIVGLLEDIKSFYERYRKVENKENEGIQDECKKWVESFGIVWENFAKPSKIGELVIRVVEKAFKVQVFGVFDSDSVENSKKNLELALKALAEVECEISLKYLNGFEEILMSSEGFFEFLQDLMKKFDEKLTNAEPKAVAMWLSELGLMSSSHLYEIVPKCRTGEFLAVLFQKLTGEVCEYVEPKGTFQRLKNIRMALEMFFSYRLVENTDESVALGIAQGDLKVISQVLTLIKNKQQPESLITKSKQKNHPCVSNLLQPQEFQSKSKTFRSVTPPHTLLSL